ncbi:MAG: hypothetical protein IJ196_07130 [Prevotella sp.]|nr:hypothetical protein [Prevotella sp.]
MSNILSYNRKTAGEDWISLSSQYQTDDIEMISDPNAGLSQQPRTAIPSPFAQMDLVKNAFGRLATHADLHGELMDEKLVSNALDVAQLFFNYRELHNQLHIVEWNRDTQLPMLKQTIQHRLLGETIEMFLEQDREAFNFDRMDRLYFLVYGNQVVGSTSPVTLFMATPNAEKGVYSIPVEQNVNFFDQWRPLYQRDPRFVKYIYALFTAYPDLKRFCGEVNRYLIANLPLLSAGIRGEVLREIGNPAALDMEHVESALTYLESNYTRLDEGVQALGIPFYGARAEDVMAAIEASDFVMVPSQKTEGPVPLVLQNHLNASPSDPFRYITNPWTDATVITPADYAPSPEKRVLPATSHEYPWLTDDDFFQPALIKLDYTSDRDCFFNGNLSKASREADGCDFLLPLKPLYFRYFDVKDLWTTIGGRPRFEMIHNTVGQNETVTAILRVPVQKRGQYITLQRVYVKAREVDLSYDTKNNRGHFITVPFAMSIFPFVRTQGLKQYNIQLVDRALGMLQNYEIALSFHKNGENNRLNGDQVLTRNRSFKSEKHVGSAYYRLSSDFDYVNVSLIDDRQRVAVEGVVCPKWNEYIQGHEQFTFAVDFGTTNTHIETMHTDSLPEPLHITSEASERLIATTYNGQNSLYDVIMKQEFLPKAIGEDYGFPQRTVLSENERLDAEHVDNIVALADANIPFIYEKESVGYGNRIVPNLKWSTEMAASKRVKAYLTELALLMRTKVLLENGDITKTRLVWFYPLAMKVGNIRKMGQMWAKTFQEVFGIPATDDNLIQMPESVAPYYYYRSSSHFRGAASTVASIDIGGGSSDVVVFDSNAQQPAVLTSFRFAANVLFGDGFSEVPQGDSNPMVQKYVDYFKRLFDADDDRYGELNGILDDIAAKRKSEDINAFLFSVINNKAVSGNDVFSYNLRLNEDEHRKIVFIYFFVTIIYYVAHMMYHRHLQKPRSVMFSGTGSKVLDIVGQQRDLDLLAQAVFERVYGESYDADGFSIIMERNEPKQITCRGALMQVRDAVGRESVNQLNRQLDAIDSQLKRNYSMVSPEQLTYDDMEDVSTRQQLVDEVRRFNSFFITLCDDMKVADRFLVDNHSFQLFRELVGKDLDHHLINGWNFTTKNQDEKNGSDPIEDTVFFYPIIGSIRDNLIEKLQ